MPKLYFGSRGGIYYRKKGRKVYVKGNRFGNNEELSDDEKEIIKDYINEHLYLVFWKIDKGIPKMHIIIKNVNDNDGVIKIDCSIQYSSTISYEYLFNNFSFELKNELEHMRRAEN